MGGIFGITGGSRFAFDVYGDLFFESPPNVVVTEGDTEVTFTFDAPTRVGQNTIDDYELEVSDESPNVTGASSPLTYTGLTNEQVYQGRVRARGTPMDGEWSTFQFFTPTAAPANVLVLSDGTDLTLSNGNTLELSS